MRGGAGGAAHKQRAGLILGRAKRDGQYRQQSSYFVIIRRESYMPAEHEKPLGKRLFRTVHPAVPKNPYLSAACQAMSSCPPPCTSAIMIFFADVHSCQTRSRQNALPISAKYQMLICSPDICHSGSSRHVRTMIPGHPMWALWRP